MNNLLDTFLSIATDEFGDKLKLSNIHYEGYTGVIVLNNHSCDLAVYADELFIHENDLSDDENKMLDAFISYVQSEMKNQSFFFQNIRNTEKSLI